MKILQLTDTASLEQMQRKLYLRVSEHYCDGSFKHTKELLAANGYDPERTIDGFKHRHCNCDCEVVANLLPMRHQDVAKANAEPEHDEGPRERYFETVIKPGLLAEDPTDREASWLEWRDYLCPDYPKFVARADEFVQRLNNHLAEHGCNHGYEGATRVLTDMGLNALPIIAQFSSVGLSCSCVIYRSLRAVAHEENFEFKDGQPPARN